jgi:hypothetical protein
MPPTPQKTTMQGKVLQECEVMLNYALANGKKIEPKILQKLKELQKKREEEHATGRSANTIDDVGDVHNMLAGTISPATPATVLLMEKTAASAWKFLGPVPLVRKMMIMTILCLAAFLGVFLSDEVNSITINGDILSYEPLAFLLNEGFIVASAALGASFYALFEAYKYIATSSYDSKYDSIYWIRFILGIVSGVLLAQFIFASTTPNSATDMGNMSIITYKPLLAFLGGFSARVVYKILNSLVDSVETFISGSARDAVRAREESAKVEIQEKVNSIQQENARKEAANRLSAVIQLMKLQEKLNNGAPNENITNELKAIINQTMMPVNNKPFYPEVTNTTNNNYNNQNDLVNPYNENPNPDGPSVNVNVNINPNTNYNDINIPDPTSFDIPEHFTGDLDHNPADEFK